MLHLVLTPEDFADIREIQPVVLTEDRLWNYETTFRGDETVDGVDCWVLQVRGAASSPVSACSTA